MFFNADSKAPCPWLGLWKTPARKRQLQRGRVRGAGSGKEGSNCSSLRELCGRSLHCPLLEPVLWSPPPSHILWGTHFLEAEAHGFGWYKIMFVRKNAFMGEVPRKCGSKSRLCHRHSVAWAQLPICKVGLVVYFPLSVKNVSPTVQGHVTFPYEYIQKLTQLGFCMLPWNRAQFFPTSLLRDSIFYPTVILSLLPFPPAAAGGMPASS